MTSAASNFMDFIEWLNSSGIPYFIAWGYEGLPEKHSGGDVDIYIHPERYVYAEQWLITRGYSISRCPAYSSHWHAQFGREGDHTIHLFSSLCFNLMGKKVILKINPDCLLHGKIKVGRFWIPDPVVETLFTALRVISGRKDCVERLEKFVEIV